MMICPKVHLEVYLSQSIFVPKSVFVSKCAILQKWPKIRKRLKKKPTRRGSLFCTQPKQDSGAEEEEEEENVVGDEGLPSILKQAIQIANCQTLTKFTLNPT